MGGGLAGLTLAIQLQQQLENICILIVEKSAFPVSKVAHKVGKS